MMTEQEWLQSADPQKMLEFLRVKAAIDRKLRLFAVAFCRRTCKLPLPICRQVVEVGERYADGLASDKERQTFEEEAGRLIDRLGEIAQEDGEGQGFTIAEDVHEEREHYRSVMRSAGISVLDALDAAYSVLDAVGDVNPFVGAYRPDWIDYATAISRPKTVAIVEIAILREIFGNPFRPVSINPAWLTWHGGLLVSMAQRMYDGRDFSDMPVLADALEEADCTDADILTHCRSGGEHVRGCWVVDLLLGKE